MTACSINLHYRCEDCTFADQYGRGCKHGLLFPVMLLLAGKSVCPNFKGKTLEQLKEIEMLKQYDAKKT